MIALVASFALAFVMQVALAKVAYARDGKIKVWKFEQRSQLGHGTLLICDSAVKMTFPQQNVQWVSSAPDWNVTITNYKLNIGKTVPLARYGQRSVSSFEFGKISGTSDQSELLFLGRPARKVIHQIIAADPIKEQFEMVYQTGSKRADSFSAVELIFSSWIKLNPNTRRFLSYLYTISDVNGVLLQQTYLYSGGKRNQVVSTDRCSQVEVDKSEFKTPTGFRKTYMHEIMQESKKAEQMSGVIEDLFLDDPKKK